MIRLLVVLVVAITTLASCGGGSSDQASTADVLKADGINRLVVIGNSITYVDTWFGGAGMAASAKELDFAHVVGSTLNLPVSVANFADLERTPVTSASRIGTITAGIDRSAAVIIEMGDNVPADGLDAFAAGYKQLLDAVAGAGRLVCVTTWWTNADKDAVIAKACTAHGGDVASIADIKAQALDPVGVYSNGDIDQHPKDKSMAMIASRVLAVVR